MYVRHRCQWIDSINCGRLGLRLLPLDHLAVGRYKQMPEQKSPLNKKQATRALCKQSSTHLGRRSDESNWLAHAIEQHLPISSDCTKLLVAVCSYGQGLSIDMLSLLGGALFTQAAHRPPARRSASPALRPPPLMGGGFCVIILIINQNTKNWEFS